MDLYKQLKDPEEHPPFKIEHQSSSIREIDGFGSELVYSQSTAFIKDDGLR